MSHIQNKTAKKHISKTLLGTTAMTVAGLLFSVPVEAQTVTQHTVPTNPAVQAGTITNITTTNPNFLNGNTKTVTVNQSSQRAVINWNTFNLGSKGHARFNQPNKNALTVNRVVAHLRTSQRQWHGLDFGPQRCLLRL